MLSASLRTTSVVAAMIRKLIASTAGNAPRGELQADGGSAMSTVPDTRLSQPARATVHHDVRSAAPKQPQVVSGARPRPQRATPRAIVKKPVAIAIPAVVVSGTAIVTAIAPS